jgi:fatty acid desaturase
LPGGDPERLRAVQWKDLLQLDALEVAHELLISAPWLIASWVAASHHRYSLALICSFLFFLTGLRQVHNAFHYALGLPRRATEWVMVGLSVLMLGSMHAVQVNHRRHHRHCLDKDDVEAMSARMPGWRAILTGPVFPMRLHQKALAVATARQRRWIWLEIWANLAWMALVFAVLDRPWLRYHVAAMAAGQCLTAFFAVWTVHHGCDPSGPLARTIRSRIKAALTYEMFYHVEHHLFPAVPTRRLPALARRLDVVAPELAAQKVF